MNNSLSLYDSGRTMQVRNENDLPMHITFEQFQIIHDKLNSINQIMWGLLWETGGRITAVLSIRWKDINFSKKELTILVQKKKKLTTIRIPLSNAMLSELTNFQIYCKADSEEYIFETSQYKREKSKVGRLTRQGAWKKVEKWGQKFLNLESIHPHMLRHGLAIYLLSKNVPIAVISARLGHSNMSITQNSYLVITPELQRQLTDHVAMR